MVSLAVPLQDDPQAHVWATGVGEIVPWSREPEGDARNGLRDV